MSVVESIPSRLDDLRIVTLTDGEVWSARDLMGIVGYTNWRNWSAAIERAKESVEASGLRATDHFDDSIKMIEVGKGARRQVEDVQITRYGCYILFQNADGSKPEIAALQQYFAVQTRRQEVAAPALSDDEIIARALQIATGRLHVLEAKVKEDAPKVAAYEQLMDAEGVYTMEAVAKIGGLGRQTLFKRLREAGVMQPVPSRLPYQRYMHWFKVTTSTWTDGDGVAHASETARVRPDSLVRVLARAGVEVDGTRPLAAVTGGVA